MSYSFLCPLLCLPQCLLNSKCSANVGEVCFVVLQVAKLPVELIYGCSACGHTNAGVAAVLIRTQLEDPPFLLLTLERVRADHWRQAVIVAPQKQVSKTEFSSLLNQREVMVVNFLHGTEFISGKVMVQGCLIKET